MLLEKLALFLDGKRGFRYVRRDYQMEIWLSDREELPVVVSCLNSCRYIISLHDFVYELRDEERAYRYIMRIFFNMDRISIDYNVMRRKLPASSDEKQTSYER